MSTYPPDPKYLLRGDMGCVHSLLFRLNSDIEHIYAGTATGKIYIWDLKTNRQTSCITVGKDPCLNLYNTNKKDLLVQSKNGSISTYKPAECYWSLDKTIDINYYSFCRCQLLSENILLVPLRDSIVGLLSLETFNIESKLDPSNFIFSNKLGEVMAIKPLSDASYSVLVAYEGGKLLLWNAKENKMINHFTVDTCPLTIDFDCTLMQGIIGGPSDKLQIFEMSADLIMSNKSTLNLKNPGTSVVTIRPDAKIVAVGGWDGRLRIFSWKNLRPLVILNQHRDTVHDTVFSPFRVKTYDTKYLMASAGRDGYISLWDIYN